MRPSRVALVELELGRDAHPAGDALDIAADGSRDSPASCLAVGACGREPPAVGTERQGVHRTPVFQGRAD